MGFPVEQPPVQPRQQELFKALPLFVVGARPAALKLWQHASNCHGSSIPDRRAWLNCFAQEVGQLFASDEGKELESHWPATPKLGSTRALAAELQFVVDDEVSVSAEKGNEGLGVGQDGGAKGGELQDRDLSLWQLVVDNLHHHIALDLGGDRAAAQQVEHDAAESIVPCDAVELLEGVALGRYAWLLLLVDGRGWDVDGGNWHFGLDGSGRVGVNIDGDVLRFQNGSGDVLG